MQQVSLPLLFRDKRGNNIFLRFLSSFRDGCEVVLVVGFHLEDSSLNAKLLSPWRLLFAIVQYLLSFAFSKALSKSLAKLNPVS